MRIRSSQDLAAGGLFIAVGVAFVVGSLNYRIGTPQQMGAGFFPLVLAGLLVLLGLAISIRAIATEGEQLQRVALAPALLIVGSVALFAIAFVWLGLIAAIFIVVFASTAIVRNPFRLETLLVASLMAVLCGGLFIGLLGVNMPLWPRF